MEQQQLLDSMIEHPIIAAVRTDGERELALKSQVRTIFLLAGDIGSLSSQVREIHAAGKWCFVHLDLIHGLRPDLAGIRFVAEQIGPEGIISTRPACIRWAHQVGLMAIQRIFLLDSTAIQEGCDSIAKAQPDLVEVLPGLADKAVQMAAAAFKVPLIAGGLIMDKDSIYAALSAGALAVSSGTVSLWSD